MAVDHLLRAIGTNPKTILQKLQGAPGVKGKMVNPIPINTAEAEAEAEADGLIDFIQTIAPNKKNESKEPFYVLDLGIVISLMAEWSRFLPMVRPYYAVKCNPDAALLGTLAMLGSNFDCASRAEIEAVLALGVSPDRIVYANPCKAESHINYAASVGVNLTTFDSEEEIEKIRRCHPQCSLLIRIKGSDDSGARCPLSSKYGALPEEIVPLLKAAHSSKLKVAGVSFHIGSAATHSLAYRASIAAAKSVFETAIQLNMPPMNILNIGGGFTSSGGHQQFQEAAKTIKSALQKYFSKEQLQDLSIIAEPGRFFAESGFTLVTNIIGKRVRGDMREYWIDDGIYGSMNCILYDYATITCKPLPCKSQTDDEDDDDGGNIPRLREVEFEERKYRTTVYGPTCDALDTILTGQQLPELQVNDRLIFPNMGAYTAAAGSSFNGFNTSAISTKLVYSNPR